MPGVSPTGLAELDGRGVVLRRAVGVHPAHDGTVAQVEVAQVEAGLEGVDVAAIGELGWDRAHPPRDALVDALVELAKARGLPVILHVVGLHGHAVERLRRHGQVQGVVHAYSGSAELVKAYVALGLHVSIGPSVRRDGARKVIAAAAAVPDGRLLVETDAPDQCAEPAELPSVVDAVARARGATVEAIRQLTYDNALALFG